MLKHCFFLCVFVQAAHSQELSRDMLSLGTLYSPNQTYKTYDLRIGAPPIILNEKVLLIPSFRAQEGSIKLPAISTDEPFKNYRINLLTRIKSSAKLNYIFNPHIEFKKITTNRKISQDSLFGSAMFLMNYKPNENPTGWRYGLGLHYSREFKSNTVIPIANAQYQGSRFRAEIGFPFTGIYFFNEPKKEWGFRIQFDSHLYRYTSENPLLLPETQGLRIWRIDIGPSAKISLSDSFFVRSSLGFLLLHEAHSTDSEATKQRLLAKKNGEIFLRLSLHYEKI